MSGEGLADGLVKGQLFAFLPQAGKCFFAQLVVDLVDFNAALGLVGGGWSNAQISLSRLTPQGDGRRRPRSDSPLSGVPRRSAPVAQA